jgi:hypothetical protein
MVTYHLIVVFFLRLGLTAPVATHSWFTLHCCHLVRGSCIILTQVPTSLSNLHLRKIFCSETIVQSNTCSSCCAVCARGDGGSWPWLGAWGRVRGTQAGGACAWDAGLCAVGCWASSIDLR